MNCDKYRDLIFEICLEETDEKSKNELKKHLAQCQNCRDEHMQITAVIECIKPETNAALTPMEKLTLENKLYKTRLQNESVKVKNIFIKRIALVAAAVLLFFLGFSSRSFYEDSFDLNNRASIEEPVDSDIQLGLETVSGNRVTPKGFLLIAKGKKAIEQIK